MPVTGGETVRADVLMEFDSTEDVINTYHLFKVSAGSLSDADVLDDMLQYFEALYTLVQTVITILVAFDKIRTINLSDATVIGEINFATVLLGTQAGDSMPPGICPLINFGTAQKGIILRKYGPPHSEAGNAADGRMGSGEIVAWANAATFLLADQVMLNSTWRYGYLSPVAGAFVEPLSASVGNIHGYQRRRRQGRGS